MISQFLERILMEHIDIKSWSGSKLQIGYVCSIRIRSSNQDMIEKPVQPNCNPYVELLNKECILLLIMDDSCKINFVYYPCLSIFPNRNMYQYLPYVTVISQEQTTDVYTVMILILIN